MQMSLCRPRLVVLARCGPNNAQDTAKSFATGTKCGESCRFCFQSHMQTSKKCKSQFLYLPLYNFNYGINIYYHDSCHLLWESASQNQKANSKHINILVKNVTVAIKINLRDASVG